MHCEIENFLSKEQINEIISVGDKTQLNYRRTNKFGVRQSYALGKGPSPGSRTQHTLELDSVEWLKKHVYKLAEEAKSMIESKYDVSIDISGGAETRDNGNEYGICSTYEKGDVYEWHKDSFPESEKELLRTRVLSAVIQLSEEQDYEGGELCVKMGEDIVTASKKQGSALVFTSDTFHMVKEVTKGARKSLIVWLHKKL